MYSINNKQRSSFSPEIVNILDCLTDWIKKNNALIVSMRELLTDERKTSVFLDDFYCLVLIEIND